MDPVDYVDAFIACADNCPVTVAEIPHGTQSVAARTWRMIADYPYRGRACLRSSDLGRRYGWGIHADDKCRLALYGLGTASYSALASGRGLQGASVKVVKAMRRSRA